MRDFIYVEYNKANIKQDVVQKFDCKHPDFNDFLRNEASSYSANGCGVTYVLVDKEEFENKNITCIFAFATIQTIALFREEDNNTRVTAIPCAEIKFFAIRRQLQKIRAQDIDPNKYYSEIFLEWFLQDLYEISTKVIGFQYVYLIANDAGKKLYERSGFANVENYLVPFEETDPDNKCIPMIFDFSTDNLYKIFEN